AAVEFGDCHKGDIHRGHPRLGDAFNRTPRASATLANGGEEIDRRLGSASNMAKRAGKAGQTGGGPPCTAPAPPTISRRSASVWRNCAASARAWPRLRRARRRGAATVASPMPKDAAGSGWKGRRRPGSRRSSPSRRAADRGMNPEPYEAAPVAIREDLAAAHRRARDHLARPGTWWDGRERVALMAEARHAVDCALCRRRKAALSPAAVAGSHDSLGDLPEIAV